MQKRGGYRRVCGLCRACSISSNTDDCVDALPVRGKKKVGQRNVQESASPPLLCRNRSGGIGAAVDVEPDILRRWDTDTAAACRHKTAPSHAVACSTGASVFLHTCARKAADADTLSLPSRRSMTRLRVCFNNWKNTVVPNPRVPSHLVAGGA